MTSFAMNLESAWSRIKAGELLASADGRSLFLRSTTKALSVGLEALVRREPTHRALHPRFLGGDS